MKHEWTINTKPRGSRQCYTWKNQSNLTRPATPLARLQVVRVVLVFLSDAVTNSWQLAVASTRTTSAVVVVIIVGALRCGDCCHLPVD